MRKKDITTRDVLRHSFSKIGLLSFMCLLPFIGFAHKPEMALKDSKEQLLVRDSSMLTGKLKNGLTYYIKGDVNNANKIHYSLILKAGAMDEDDSQRGLAHFNEHISFDGTPSFPQNLVDGTFIKNIDRNDLYINAFTTKTETVYSLVLPNDRKTLQDTAISLLSEWLMCDFDSDESIEKQKHIIAKEWLELQNASERMRLKWHPALFNDVKWGYRRSIGEIDVINKASKEEIVRFRKDWYRPDLAAISIVGNFDKYEMLKKVEQYFLKHQNTKSNRAKEEVVIPHTETRNVIVVSDKDEKFSYMSMYNRRPNPNLSTKEGVKRSLSYHIINRIASERYMDCQEKNSDVVIYIGGTISSMLQPDNLYSPYVSFTKGQVVKALEILAREQERIVQHGYLDEEFDSAIKISHDQYSRALEGGGKSPQQWVKAIEQDFLNSSLAMTTQEEAKVYLPILETITKEDIEHLQKDLWAEYNSLLLITVPQEDLSTVPSKEKIVEIMTQMKNEKHVPYQKTVLNEEVFTINHLGKSGKIKREEKVVEELPIYKMTLSNGAKIVYYEDSTKSDMIYFEAVSKGGKFSQNSRDKKLADLTCDIINNGPIGIYTKPQFNRYLGQDNMSMDIFINDGTENIKGNVSNSSFELLLKRLYLLFNEFSVDEYKDIFTQRLSFFNASYISNNNYYSRFIENKRSELENVDNTALKDAELVELKEVMNRHFGKMSDFTFYFTGALSNIEFESLVLKYLGTGKKQKAERESELSINALSGEYNFILKKGTDPRANVTYSIGAPFVMDLNNSSILHMAVFILNKHIYEHIREKLHMVYSSTTELKVQMVGGERADIVTTFQCDPKDCKTIYSEINKIVEKFIKNGFDSKEVELVRGMVIHSKKTYASNDNFRLGAMRGHDQYYNNDYTQHLNNISFIENITLEDLQKALSQIYNSPKSLKAGFVQVAE